MKILPYQVDHSAGDSVYLLGKFFFGKKKPRQQTLMWGKAYTVDRSTHWKNDNGDMELGIVLEDHPKWVFAAEHFVNQNDWMLIDLAVFNLIYSNKNKDGEN